MHNPESQIVLSMGLDMLPLCYDANVMRANVDIQSSGRNMRLVVQFHFSAFSQALRSFRFVVRYTVVLVVAAIENTFVVWGIQD